MTTDDAETGSLFASCDRASAVLEYDHASPRSAGRRKRRESMEEIVGQNWSPLFLIALPTGRCRQRSRTVSLALGFYLCITFPLQRENRDAPRRSTRRSSRRREQRRKAEVLYISRDTACPERRTLRTRRERISAARLYLVIEALYRFLPLVVSSAVPAGRSLCSAFIERGQSVSSLMSPGKWSYSEPSQHEIMSTQGSCLSRSRKCLSRQLAVSDIKGKVAMDRGVVGSRWRARHCRAS